jgi:hypothetical protein
MLSASPPNMPTPLTVKTVKRVAARLFRPVGSGKLTAPRISNVILFENRRAAVHQTPLESGDGRALFFSLLAAASPLCSFLCYQTA